jgi:peptidyl-tRNA hydrolase
MTESTYVQPIVLLVDKADPASHREGIHAAALASVLAYAQELATSGADPSWDEWLSGRFTKTVRRADAKTFVKLAEKFSDEEHADVTIGKARALAFRPTTYDAMSRALAKLQVSGTELPDHDAMQQWPLLKNVPVLFLNGSLGMSTGKAAAQAAHGLFAWYLSLDVPARTAWYESGCQFRVQFVDQEAFDATAAEVPERLRIVDSGLTEIDPDTATAYVLA